MTGILIYILKFYKKTISAYLEFVFGHACRFTPTCSEYSIEALQKFGLFKGLKLGIIRLSKCHPFGGFGYDPIPSK
jgi:hypothetical protein